MNIENESNLEKTEDITVPQTQSEALLELMDGDPRSLAGVQAEMQLMLLTGNPANWRFGPASPLTQEEWKDIKKIIDKGTHNNFENQETVPMPENLLDFKE